MQEIANRLSPSINQLSGSFNSNPYITGLKQQLENQLERINMVFNPAPVAVSAPIGNVDWANELYYEGMDIRSLPSRELPGGSYP